MRLSLSHSKKILLLLITTFALEAGVGVFAFFSHLEDETLDTIQSMTNESIDTDINAAIAEDLAGGTNVRSVLIGYFAVQSELADHRREALEAQLSSNESSFRLVGLLALAGALGSMAALLDHPATRRLRG